MAAFSARDYERHDQRAAGMTQQIDLLSRIRTDVEGFKFEYIRLTEETIRLLNGISSNGSDTTDAVREQTKQDLSFEEQRQKDLEEAERKNAKRQQKADKDSQDTRQYYDKISRTFNAVSSFLGSLGISLDRFIDETLTYNSSLNEYVRESGASRETAKGLGDSVKAAVDSLNETGTALYDYNKSVSKIFGLVAQGYGDTKFLEEYMEEILEADMTSGTGLRTIVSLFDSFYRRYNMTSEESKGLLDSIVANTASSNTTSEEVAAYLIRQQNVIEDVAYRAGFSTEQIIQMQDNVSKAYAAFEGLKFTDEQTQGFLDILFGAMSGDFKSQETLAALQMYETGPELARLLLESPEALVAEMVNRTAEYYTSSDYNAMMAGYLGLTPGALTHAGVLVGQSGAPTESAVAAILAGYRASAADENEENRANRLVIDKIEEFKNRTSTLANNFLGNNSAIVSHLSVIGKAASMIFSILSIWTGGQAMSAVLQWLGIGTSAAGGAAAAGGIAAGSKALNALKIGSGVLAGGAAATAIESAVTGKQFAHSDNFFVENLLWNIPGLRPAIAADDEEKYIDMVDEDWEKDLIRRHFFYGEDILPDGWTLRPDQSNNLFLVPTDAAPDDFSNAQLLSAANISAAAGSTTSASLSDADIWQKAATSGDYSAILSDPSYFARQVDSVSNQNTTAGAQLNQLSPVLDASTRNDSSYLRGLLSQISEDTFSIKDDLANLYLFLQNWKKDNYEREDINRLMQSSESGFNDMSLISSDTDIYGGSIAMDMTM